MKIAVLSRGRTLYSTRRIAEVGRKRKHDVRVIDPHKCMFGTDGAELIALHDGLDLSGFDVVIPRIGATTTPYGLALLRQFELRGTPTINRSSAIQKSRDKFHTAQILAAAGVPTPRTLSTREASCLPALVERLGGPPVVVKMTSGTQGVGVIVSDTIEAAQSTVQAMWSLGQEITLQEFVIESRGRDLRVFVVDGQIVGAMRREAPTGEFRANLHQGGEGVAVELTEDLAAIAREAVEVVGLDVAGVDVLESERGPLVLEVNSSPGLQGIETVTGRDVARDVIRCAERRTG